MRHSPLGAAWRATRRTTRDLAQGIKQGSGAIRARGSARLQALALEDPARALRLARRARALLPRSLFFAQAEALLTARCHGWAAAAPLFEAITALSGPPATALLRPPQPGPALPLVLPARDRPARPSREDVARIVIYTAVFGPGRRPPAPLTGLDGMRFVCFTDQDIRAPGWQVERLRQAPDDPELAAAFCRICPHEILPHAAPDADWSLYVAPEMLMIGNLDALVTRWLLPHALVAGRHADCTDWHDLAERHLLREPARAGSVLAQALACEAAGLPRDCGACDTRILWRRHGQADVVRLMDAWWAAFQVAPGADDLGFCRLLNDPGAPPPVVPQILPAALGPVGDNIFFASVPNPPGTGPGAPALPGQRRLPVAFVYGRGFASYASTLLRGQQLSELVAAHHSDRYEVSYVDETAAPRDQVVILTKGALRVLRPSDITALRARNIAVIASWDDDIPDPAKVRTADAQMAVSLRQMLAMNRRFPASPTFFVTHHVNPRILPVTPPADRLRTGYFGELLNTVRPASLAGMVEMNGINTTQAGGNWMDALPRYNCHWIIRRKQSFDGWKPFLKGFVAARCGAIVIVARDDDDAAYYLGDDYPFYVRSLDPADLEADMVGFTTAYGGPDWHRAQEIMGQVGARSTDAVVAAEFRAMIDAVTG